MTLSRAVMLKLIQRYLSGLMDTSISLLEIHKLMYFMQESGEGLKLRYAKAPYGPYAENLRHALSAVEGHFLHGYGDGEDAPTRQIELNAEAAARGTQVIEGNDETEARLKRVADLIGGFETPFGMNYSRPCIGWRLTAQRIPQKPWTQSITGTRTSECFKSDRFVSLGKSWRKKAGSRRRTSSRKSCISGRIISQQ